MVICLSVNHVRDNEVRRRLFLQAPHVPKGRNEGPRKDSPEEMRRSRQESVLTPYSRRMGYNDVVQLKNGTWIRISDNVDSLNTFVINLNVSLDKLDLEIVPFVGGLTGKQVYIY